SSATCPTPIACSSGWIYARQSDRHEGPMKTTKKLRTTRAFEKALAARPTGKYILRLYVAGATDRSRRAVLRARQLCETELAGNFELKVIDVYQQPILARDGQIVA